MKRKSWLLALTAAVALAVGIFSVWGSEIEFILGGAMVNLGYRLQDRLEPFDMRPHEVKPQDVWDELVVQNRLASAVRATWPRSNHHPLVAMVTCMDARLDTNEIAGDTRRYYYVLRLAGSVISPKEEEMLELAVANGTRLIIFTTHSDCAAEKASRDPAQAKLYPELSKAIADRRARFDEFLARPNIRQRMDRGELLVKVMHIDTATERITSVDRTAFH